MIESSYILLASAFAASTLAAIAGTGGSVILLPVIISQFGVREGIPIYAVAQVIGNLSRVYFNRELIDYRVVLWFALGAIPFAIPGSWLFTRIPDAGVQKLLGLFLILSILFRRVRHSQSSKWEAYWFAPIGSVFSAISAIVGSVGPFLAPFYLSFGLTKGAFIGTEALGTAIMHLAKLACYQGLGAISGNMWFLGFALGPVMIVGSFAGKQILDKIPKRVFLLIVEIAVVGFGIWFIIK